ncbi:MAG: ATP-binding protein [bacterium]
MAGEGGSGWIFRLQGLRSEILGNLTVVSLFALMLAGIGVWCIHQHQLIAQSLLRGSQLLESLQEEIVDALARDPGADPWLAEPSREQVQRLLDRCREREPELRLVLVDSRLRVRAASGAAAPEEMAKHKTLSLALGRRGLSTSLKGNPYLNDKRLEASLALPLERHGKLEGGILASLPLDEVHANSRQLARFIVVYLGAGTLVLLFFGTILISRAIVRPLEKMTGVMERVAEGDLDQVVQVSGENEMSRLAETFNRMAAKLKAQQKTLNRHVLALRQMNHELKRTQQEVIQSEKLASVGLLAAGLAHEIGNPLSAILGYIGMLKEGIESPEERIECLNRSEREVYRIHRIVKDLQEYSRPDLGQVRLLHLNQVIGDTVGLVSRQREFREIVFDVRLGDERTAVRADAGQLQQVLVNLFLNAKDALGGRGRIRVISRKTSFALPEDAARSSPARRKDDPGGVDFRLLRKDDPGRRQPFLEGQELIEVEVRDEGAGIPPEHLQRVFDPFFTTKEVGKGTGLGLSVSQRIIEAFHGDIRIESRLGEGTLVRVRLPIAEEDQIEEIPKDEKECAHR